MRLLIKWLICVVVFFAASELFAESVIVSGGALTLVIAGSVLWLVNILIRPIVQVLAFPVTLLTVGLFSLVVNAGMVFLTDSMLPDLKITSFWVGLLIALVISIANSMTKKKCKE